MMRQDERWDSLSPSLRGSGSRASSSCAACKMLKRRCRASCIFAPYFRSDEGTKFAKVHKVFGASNVSKLLVEVPPEHREDAVNSLAYEAEARLLDPVYGCIGAIALLHTRLSDLSRDLALARARLAHYTQQQAQSTATLVVGDYGSSSSSSTANTTAYYDFAASTNNNSSVYDYGFVPYIL